MPRTITQYNVFIGSPGGLDAERQAFRKALEKCSFLHGQRSDVRFHPVGWEDTVGGVGRPQELINEDLRSCDYAVFVLHDRWGTPPGPGFTSGTEEEFALAEQLYKENKIRNIALLFKAVDPARRADPGPQVQGVIAFRQKIEADRRYLFKQYATAEEFSDLIEQWLASWLGDHDKTRTSPSASGLSLAPVGEGKATSALGFADWIAEASSIIDGESVDYHAAKFCAEKALDAARDDLEWAQATSVLGVSQHSLGQLEESIACFESIAARFAESLDADRRQWCAKALFNKGVTLGMLGRDADAIAVYDDLVGRYGTATEPPLRELVAKGLFNKGATLGRDADAIAVYDDLVARFGTAIELPLRQHVAKALLSKGITLGTLGRRADEIAVYDDLVARFGAATELPLRELVAKGLLNKGVTLGRLGRGANEIAVYDDFVARFGAAVELPLREQVAMALVNKGAALRQLGRTDEAQAVYDDVRARFGAATEPSLRAQVDRAEASGLRRRKP